MFRRMTSVVGVQEFLIGKPAAEILISYHALQHFKFLMHQKCQEEVSSDSLFPAFHASVLDFRNFLCVSVRAGTD